MSTADDLEDDQWHRWAAYWRFWPDTIYLNHGSFGPPPRPVQREHRRWQRRLWRQPMDFFVRQYEDAMRIARECLAEFVGTAADNLVMVDNATYAMNVVAESFPLEAGDEVILTDHEYGAVVRIWRRACRRAAAVEPVVAALPPQLESDAEIVDAIMACVTPRTRLIVASHITSATALILPVAALCQKARERNIAVCIDGPHALAQLDLNLSKIDCDFYTASCHKWLSAPFGSGFLYVHPRRQHQIEPPILSWGRLEPNRPASWRDEFIWIGTRDPSPFLTVPAAIQFLRRVGLEAFRAQTHQLAKYAHDGIVQLTGQLPLAPNFDHWYGSMAHLPLPPGETQSLQNALWERFGIEVPIVRWKDRRFVRVSCHLYTRREQLDRLMDAMGQLLAQEG